LENVRTTLIWQLESLRYAIKNIINNGGSIPGISKRIIERSITPHELKRKVMAVRDPTDLLLLLEKLLVIKALSEANIDIISLNKIIEREERSLSHEDIEFLIDQVKRLDTIIDELLKSRGVGSIGRCL